MRHRPIRSRGPHSWSSRTSRSRPVSAGADDAGYRRRPLRRRILVSAVTVAGVLTLQLHSAPRTADGVLPSVRDIGIGTIEAQPAGPETGIPVHIAIPAIGVDARVTPVGLLGGGKLDVPADRADAGWYELGALPGARGNAVIDGHLETGSMPGVFWDLKKLVPGDIVSVTDDRGVTRDFRVKKSVVYGVHDAPMEHIFGAGDGKNLNLITCAGVWRKELGHYDRRLVVFTEQADGQVLP